MPKICPPLPRVALALCLGVVSALGTARIVRAELFSTSVYTVQPLEIASDRTTSIAFSPDNSKVAWGTASDEGGELFWGYDDNGLRWIKVLDANPEGAYVSFSSDNKSLVVASPLIKPKKDSPYTAATLQVLDTTLDDNLPRHIVQVPKSRWKIELPKYSATETIFSPDNTLLAGICNDQTVRLWNATNGQLLKSLAIGRDVKAIAFAKNGELMVAAGAKTKGELQWWNLSTSKAVRKADVGPSFESLFLTTDGGTYMTSDAKGNVTFWNATTRVKTKTLALPDSAAKIKAFSPDNTLFAGYTKGATPTEFVLALWDAETGEFYSGYSSNRGPDRPIVFSPDTKHIATGGAIETDSSPDSSSLNVWPVN